MAGVELTPLADLEGLSSKVQVVGVVMVAQFV